MSEYKEWGGNYSDDDANDHEEDTPFAGRSALLLVVDCARYMFDKDAASESKFEEFLSISEAIMRNKAIASENDLIGVVFYNTKHSPPSETEDELQSSLVAPKQCAIFIPLTTMSVEMILKIREMRKPTGFSQFESKYGHSEGTNMANVLWLCSRIFPNCGYKLEQSTIVLFTSNDQPHVNNTYEYQQALIKARDLQQKDIAVALVPLSVDFECSKFYKEFLCTVLEEDVDDFVAPVYHQSKEHLLKRIFTKDFKKRALVHLKWYISNEIALGVNVYSLSRKPRLPKKVKLIRTTNEVVVAKRVYVSSTQCDEGGEEETKALLPAEQRRSIVLGGETLSFKSEEMALMKQLLPPSIRLLGFKTASKVVMTNHLRGSLFLYPNESQINGSTTLFRAIYEKCLEKAQVAYCILTLRRKYPPKLVALVPQEKQLDAGGDVFRHSGFRVEFIPYGADIRTLPVLEETSVPEVTDEQTDLFKMIIKKIRFKFNPAHFANPSSQNLFINIESILFEENPVRFDSTLPDCEKIDSKLEPILTDMQNLFVEDTTGAPKRSKTDGNECEPRAKSSRLDPVNDEELIQMVKQGKVASLTVAVLKEYLQKQGVTGLSKKTKTALIEQILETEQKS